MTDTSILNSIALMIMAASFFIVITLEYYEDAWETKRLNEQETRMLKQENRMDILSSNIDYFKNDADLKFIEQRMEYFEMTNYQRDLFTELLQENRDLKEILKEKP